MPVHVQPIQLHPVLQDDVAAATQLLSGNPGAKRLGPSGDRSEIAFDPSHGLVEVDLSDHRQAGVGGHIEPVKESRDIIQRSRLEILHDTDGEPVVRVLGRIHRLGNERPNHAIGAVGVVLAVFVLDHSLLDLQLRLVDGGQKVGQPIRLHRQDGFQMRCGNVHEVVGAIARG